MAVNGGDRASRTLYLDILQKKEMSPAVKESDFQAGVIRRLKEEFPGCVVLKNDACYIQGFPDLLFLYGDSWAALECKIFARASRQPNQEYYIEKLNEMSFARFIYPENEEEVFDDLHTAFRHSGPTRFSVCE